MKKNNNNPKGNPATLTQKKWVKGQSGNPAGSKPIPKELKNFKHAAKIECMKPGFQKKVFDMAKEGNAKAIEMTLYYGEGKPKETVDVNMKNLAPIVVPVRATRAEWDAIVKKKTSQPVEDA